MTMKPALIPEEGLVSAEPLRIYTGILGQIGDIIGFTATVRRIRQLFPNSQSPSPSAPATGRRTRWWPVCLI